MDEQAANNDAPEPKDKRPRWLRKLKRESWQAELLISGVALYGSLQLPGVLRSVENYLLLNVTDEILSFSFFALSYWVLFVYSLIALFVYHFIVRALWIGMLGLSSVYPEGFVETNLTSKHFQEQARREYGDIDGYIRRLDRHASTIFGAGFGYAGVFLNLGVLASTGVGLVVLLSRWGVDSTLALTLVLGTFGAIFTFLIGLSFLNLPKLRDREWTKKWQFPLVRLSNFLFYPINNRYTITTISLLSSQAIKKQEAKSKLSRYGGLVAAVFIMFAIGASVVFTGGIPVEFIDRVYFRTANDATKITEERYADQAYEGVYFGPVVPTLHHPVDRAVEVWVPLPERELSLLKSGCSVPEVEEDLPRLPRSLAKRQRNITCAREYITPYLNDSPVTDFTILRETQTTAAGDQFGVRLRFGRAFRADEGINTIKIVTKLPNPSDDEEAGPPYRETYVPFYGVTSPADY